MDPLIRDLADAIQRSPVASSPGVSALLSRAIARSVELGRNSDSISAEFFRQLSRDLLRLRGRGHAKARLECLFRACAFLWQYGETQEALRIASHAVELALSTRDACEIRRYYLALGVLQADVGDSGLALQSYLKSLEVAFSANDRHGECCAWNNLSALFVNSGLLGEALACADQCLRKLEQIDVFDLDLQRRATNNVVLARYRLGDHSGALAIARRLASTAPEPQTPYDATSRINLEQHLVLALIAQGALV